MRGRPPTKATPAPARREPGPSARGTTPRASCLPHGAGTSPRARDYLTWTVDGGRSDREPAPRARRGPGRRSERVDITGTNPACAGTTIALRPFRQRSRDQPRGERRRPPGLAPSQPRSGSSLACTEAASGVPCCCDTGRDQPRVRGDNLATKRAWATCRDQPCVRGGNDRQERAAGGGGTSPRAWGQLGSELRGDAAARTSPARAGTTACYPATDSCWQEQPHEGGDDHRPNFAVDATGGLAPRGDNDVRKSRYPPVMGTSPACAGTMSGANGPAD